MSIDTSKLKRYKPGYVHSNDGPGYISMLARDDGEYVRLDDVQAITSALEQALNQQRGEVSAGDAVFAFSAMLTSLPHVVPFGACAWATPGAELATAFNEANGLSVSRDFPQGLKFPEIAGKLLGIVEKAAAQEDTTPQPSADAVRELVKRILDWQPLTSMNKADRLYQILVAAGLPFDVIEDDLLSLLDGKGVAGG